MTAQWMPCPEVGQGRSFEVSWLRSTGVLRNGIRCRRRFADALSDFCRTHGPDQAVCHQHKSFIAVGIGFKCVKSPRCFGMAAVDSQKPESRPVRNVPQRTVDGRFICRWQSTVMQGCKLPCGSPQVFQVEFPSDIKGRRLVLR